MHIDIIRYHIDRNYYSVFVNHVFYKSFKTPTDAFKAVSNITESIGPATIKYVE